MAKRDYQKLVNDLMRDLGMNQTAFGKHVGGAAQATVSRWANGVHPDPEFAHALDELSLRTYSQENQNHDNSVSVLRVTGRVGAGAEIMPQIEQIPPEGLFEVEVEFPVRRGARAFEVDGKNMWPRFKPGDVLICWTEATSHEEPIGWEAVVQTADGHRFVKDIEAGRERGLYDLVSHFAPTMRDVKVDWISRIDLIVPAANWRPRPLAATQKRKP